MQLLSHNYFLFASDRKCLKIIAFSKLDALKMNGSSIGLGKKWPSGNTVCSYCSKDVSVANMKEGALTWHIKGKNHEERSLPDQCT